MAVVAANLGSYAGCAPLEENTAPLVSLNTTTSRHWMSQSRRITSCRYIALQVPVCWLYAAQTGGDNGSVSVQLASGGTFPV